MVQKDKASHSAEERVAAAAEAKRTRKQRLFPASSFEDAVSFAEAILEFGSGQPVRRLSLFDSLQKSPESSASRMMITNASKYGLMEGSYASEQLKLTVEGRKAVDKEYPPTDRAKVRCKLAIEDIEPFAGLYTRFVGNRLPARAALIDAVKELGVSNEFAEEAIDTFIVNLRYVGLLQTLSGADRIVTVEHLLESLPRNTATPLSAVTTQGDGKSGELITSDAAHFESVCFYITPIGEPDSIERKHSDLFLGSIVEQALEPFKLKVIRADAIDKPGTITRQVIEHLVKSRLVIADLSFHNPNVFYELALRHAIRKPVVQLIRSGDKLPFDVGQTRSIRIDTTDIYSLVPKLDTYRSEIASQVRKALEDPESVDNPLTIFYPSLKVVAT